MQLPWTSWKSAEFRSQNTQQTLLQVLLSAFHRQLAAGGAELQLSPRGARLDPSCFRADSCCVDPQLRGRFPWYSKLELESEGRVLSAEWFTPSRGILNIITLPTDNSPSLNKEWCSLLHSKHTFLNRQKFLNNRKFYCICAWNSSLCVFTSRWTKRF